MRSDRLHVVKHEVDTTLIETMLAMTPQQRIQHNDRMLRQIQELRDGLAQPRQSARDPRRS